MASTIKGITVKIGGDTVDLKKALESTTKTSKNLQSELNQVNKLPVCILQDHRHHPLRGGCRLHEEGYRKELRQEG